MVNLHDDMRLVRDYIYDNGPKLFYDVISQMLKPNEVQTEVKIISYTYICCDYRPQSYMLPLLCIDVYMLFYTLVHDNVTLAV